MTDRFDRSGGLDDLDRAVAANRGAADAAEEGSPERASRLNNLASAYQQRSIEAGRLADLELAVAAAEAAVEATPPGDALAALYLSNLGTSLRSRFNRIGRRADLDQAIAIGQAAVDATPADSVELHYRLTMLGGSLLVRFQQTGRLDDLDGAIAACQAAVDHTPLGDADLAANLFNLGAALVAAFDRRGQLADLDRAVAVTQSAVDATKAGSRDLPARLSNLGLALRTRFRRTNQPVDLDRAIAASQAAVDATAQHHHDLPAMLSNLGLALDARFDRTGQQDDLDRAVAASQAAVDATARDDPGLPTYLSNLGVTTRARFRLSGELADLDRTVAAFRAAVDALPDDHPNLAIFLPNLGHTLEARFRQTGRPTDRDDALTVYRRASQLVTAAPAERSRSGRSWAELATRLGDWAQARAGYDSVLEVLPQLVDHRLSPDDRRYQLTQLRGLGPRAAYSHVSGGRDTGRGAAGAAWLALEAGRGVLLSQSLETRTDLADLQRAYPALAERVTRLRRELNQDPADAQEDASARRAALAGEWTMMLAQIRDLPAFERFGLPPTLEQMHAAAGDGSVVAILATPGGGGALLLTATTVGYLDLPGLTDRHAVDQANRFLAAVYPQSGAVDSATILDVLGWLWDTVAGPVLDHLGHPQPPPADGGWPRVWWIPTGAVSVLPLHAAGRHDDGARATVLDRVVSSYAPTVRALLHSQRRDMPAPSANALSVGIDEVPGLRPLRFAEDEAREVCLRLAATTPPLLGTGATHDAVTAALPGTAWAHFACHAYADPDDPAESFLALHDRPLRVRELSGMDLGNAYLAMLSACTTAVTGPDLLDEPVHFASAFQLAGFAHTIATLWPISDPIAPFLTDDIYDHLAAGTSPALAIHHAVRAMRANPDTVGSPQLWASHIHLGP